MRARQPIQTVAIANGHPIEPDGMGSLDHLIGV
jgi:hypothetical protein